MNLRISQLPVSPGGRKRPSLCEDDEGEEEKDEEAEEDHCLTGEAKCFIP